MEMNGGYVEFNHLLENLEAEDLERVLKTVPSERREDVRPNIKISEYCDLQKAKIVKRLGYELGKINLNLYRFNPRRDEIIRELVGLGLKISDVDLFRLYYLTKEGWRSLVRDYPSERRHELDELESKLQESGDRKMLKLIRSMK